MAGRDRKFHCVMTSEEWSKLTWLSEYTGLTRSTIVRQAIWLRHKVSHGRSNVCADGNQCLCPNLRQFPTRFGDQTEDLPEEEQQITEDDGGAK